MGGNYTQTGAKYFAVVVGYVLSVVTTEGEGVDGACVVIANLALRWLRDGYEGFCSYPCPLPTHAAQNAAWMGHGEWWLGWEGQRHWVGSLATPGFRKPHISEARCGAPAQIQMVELSGGGLSVISSGRMILPNSISQAYTQTTSLPL
uniref:Uncharacterized protein n=1 Tax=mine drainage metagenome TaxID=410659 RepID=E6PYA0_9ZZZZ